MKSSLAFRPQSLSKTVRSSVASPSAANPKRSFHTGASDFFTKPLFFASPAHVSWTNGSLLPAAPIIEKSIAWRRRPRTSTTPSQFGGLSESMSACDWASSSIGQSLFPAYSGLNLAHTHSSTDPRSLAPSTFPLASPSL